MKESSGMLNTKKVMRTLADSITKYLPGWGFMVLIFPFEDEEWDAHYISNARREDMIKVLRLKADVLEQNLENLENSPTDTLVN